MDESFSYLNDMPRMGRSPKGKKVRRSREAHAVRYMFALAKRTDGFIHAPAISKKTMTDEVIMIYVRAHLVPNLRAGDVVIWDRLGKAGRCLNPKNQHFNPEAKAFIEEKGAKVMFLPPKGKLWVRISVGHLPPSH
jgi:hypothetical protein